MHEYSISSEIVKTVLDAAAENGTQKVLSVQLEIGELALLNAEQVTFWIRELFRGTVAEGAKVKVKAIKARIICNGCGYQGRMPPCQGDPLQHFIPLSCPKCSSSRIRLEKGRECLLRNIQAVK